MKKFSTLLIYEFIEAIRVHSAAEVQTFSHDEIF